MTTAEIINQMEKSFDEKFPEMWGSNDGREGYDTDIKETVIDFFSSNLRTLLESFGEEVVGHDKSIPEHMKDYKFHSIACEISAENRLKAEQRLKVKEIISSIGK